MSGLGEVLLRTLIWGLAGVLFAGVYGALVGYLSLSQSTSDWLATTTATSIGGTVTAAFFGSMLTAMMAAMLGVLAAIAFLVLFGDQGSLVGLMATAAGVAFVAGRTLSKAQKLRTRPFGQTLSGLIAGLIAGPIVAFISTATGLPLQHAVMAGIAVAGVGILFVALHRHIVPACPDWLSVRVGAPVVTAIIAAIVAAGLWLVGSSVSGTPAGLTPLELEAIFRALPTSLAGGAIGGASGGVALTILGVNLQEMRV